MAAEQARDYCGLDQVWFMPAHTPPHKRQRAITPAPHRLEMLKRATAAHPHLRVEELELARGGVAYTADSMMELCRRYPEHDFACMLGADMIASLPGWRGFGELAARVSFIGIERHGCPIDRQRLPAELRETLRITPVSPIGISSTDIRRKRQEGRTIRYMVPDPVMQYIEENGLYFPGNFSRERSTS
jgi:nicotinate-nucleotide adenylyltransferase